MATGPPSPRPSSPARNRRLATASRLDAPGGDGVRVHVVAEPRDPSVAQDEHHRPVRLDDLAGRLDALALMAEDHHLVPLGEIFAGLERLELGLSPKVRKNLATSSRPRWMPAYGSSAGAAIRHSTSSLSRSSTPWMSPRSRDENIPSTTRMFACSSIFISPPLGPFESTTPVRRAASSRPTRPSPPGRRPGRIAGRSG